MTEVQNLEEHARFVAAKRYTSVASLQSVSYEVVETEPFGREGTFGLVNLHLERESGGGLFLPSYGASSGGWTRSRTSFEAKEEQERRERLHRAIDELRKLKDGWAGEGSSAPTEHAIRDARTFVALVPEGCPEPTVSVADDGEILVDWVSGYKKAVVGLEGDGLFGYALYEEGCYRPGDEEGDLSKNDLPADLKDYLLSMKKR